MFKFLKEKLKSAISKISEGVEKEGKAEALEPSSVPPSVETIVEKPAEKAEEIEAKEAVKSAPREEKGFFAKLKEKIVGKEEKPAIEEKKEDIPIVKELFKPEEERKVETKRDVKPQAEHKKEGALKEKQIEHKKEEIRKAHEGKKEAKPQAHVKKHEEEIIKAEKGYELKPKLEAKEQQKKPEIKEVPKKKPLEEVKKPETAKIPEEKPIEEPEKKGFFAKLTEKIITTKINEGQFEKLFWDLELAMMENNVAVEVIDKIKNDLKNELVEKPIRRTKVEETIVFTLKNSIEELFQDNGIDLISEIKNKKEKPYVIAFFGINGSGKTTSIAKLANMLKENGISVVLAAGDTFRAASIEQLQLHADKIGVKLIKHDYGSDPAAVAFDAIKHAKAKAIDVVLIDTAGRMHSNTNLIDEMKKIIRVAKPDLKIFVGESITGNDCIEQAKTFNESVGIDGIILAKADIDEKGGAAISVSYITKKPILYLGVGQNYGDLEEFDKEKVIRGIGLGG
ncbi:signal recognition particle-docking protein FtsY [Candidatus Woesearchaeota archaeon]|nr:signal recognition particle-docking protein FtsY [Candidatus Woesearchaeota archaeon]